MTQGFLQIAVFCAILIASVPLLGGYMARVFTDERVFLTPVVAPVERRLYRLFRVDPEQGQDWKAYARSLLIITGIFGVLLFVILRTQGLQPFNPEHFKSGTWDVSFNTATSFLTNTNWQYYGGETTLSYFSQMAGLAVQNFVSAAVGIAVLVALMRGIAARHGDGTLGNFYKDLTRIILYILVPISVVVAVVLVSQGVLQTLGGTVGDIARGPVASQEAIKMLGTNGGGFFNVNSSHPFENPTAFSNFFEMFVILLDPRLAALHVRAHGRQPPPGLDDLRGDVRPVHHQRGGRLPRRAPRHARAAPGRRQHRSGDGQHRRQHGGQGAALRHRVLDAVHRDHDRRVVRRRQRRVRVADRPRRPGPDDQPGLQRVGLRRRRHRAVHDAPVRPAGGLHRRPDGRAHAGVPGQEDRAQGRQARRRSGRSSPR